MGVTLIETLVALAILGFIGVTFLSGMSIAFRATMISQERVAAESLAKSQLEHIKIEDYIPIAEYNPEDPAKRYESIALPQELIDGGYSIVINTPQIIISANGTSFECQNITTVIKRNEEVIFTISDYKAGRVTL